MTTDDNRIDPYINRELHPPAARALAQAALDDPDLFEELTAIALAQAALESPATTDRALAQAALENEELFDALVASGAAAAGLPPRTRPKRWPLVLAGAVAAGLLTFFVLRPSAPPASTQQQAHTVTAKPSPTIVLTAELRPSASPESPVFRGGATAGRAPKSEGKIIAIEDGVATMDLGSVDGIARGQEIGGIRITTVFRDRARGEIRGNSVRLNDPVRVPGSIHVKAILEEVNALAASGNLAAARDMARGSLSAGSPGETRALLERLAALDYQAGAADAARERYEVAVNNFDQPAAAGPAERASTLASYGTLCLLHGDLQLGRTLLRQALAQQPSAADRAVIEANLASTRDR
jgi:tetratricopeptide (TPR) repeat protein